MVPTSCSHWYFLPLPNLRTDVLQKNPGNYSWEIIYFENDLNCYTRYSLLNVLMSFLIFYFSFRFYSTWCCRHIMKHFHTLNNSESEIKFWGINWYNFRGYLVSWGGSSSVNFIFLYHWNAFNDIKSPTCKSKITTFHIRQW